MAEGGHTAAILRRVIEEYYDLGEIDLPKPLEKAHQRRHRKLFVDTERGRYLIKTYARDPVVLDNLRFQHRLSDHLNQNGLPVARIQPSRSGRRIVELDNWALELQEFVAGTAMQVNSETLPIAADALGKFHQVCRGFPCPHRDARKWRFSEVPREIFGKLYERARREGGAQELDSHCNQIALFIRDATEILTLERLGRLETGLIHGDWHSGNLLFVGNRLRAIVDLEFAGDGCYLEDIAYAVSNLCVRTAIEYKRLETRTDLLLSRYQRYRTLAPAEEQVLYYAVGVKQITTVCYQSLQVGKLAGYSAVEWMRILDNQTRWLGMRGK